jgi:two-component system sensor kinase FixL
VGALAIILVQSATIVALAVQRRRARRAQAALEESRQLTELASSAGGLGLWSREMDGSGFWANTYMRDLFGFGPHDELSFEAFFSRVHRDDRARVLADAERAETAGLPFEAEFRTNLPDGTQRWVLAKGQTVSGGSGRAARRMGVVLDITRRRQAEQSLDQQRTFLRQVIDVNPNFIFAKDREGRFTLANKAVADAYGVSVDDLIGRTDADFNPNAIEVDFFREVDQEVMDTLQERFIPEESITDAQGRTRWLQTVKRPLIGSDGIANHVLGASTDITQRKKTELELQAQRMALAHVARVAIVGELFASLAHELNQPLTAILANAQASLRLMSREPPDLAEVRAALDDIVEADHRAAEVIRRTRALVKKEEVPAFATLELGELIRDVVRLVRNDAMLHDVRVSLELQSDSPPVRGDRVQLQQVLLNIILNAFDAMKARAPGTRHLTVRMERNDGTLRVAVSDCGPGIDADEIRRIFEPFYTTKREGLGMGLPICRSIVESHGGRLWAQNNPDGGATFYFTVPVEKTSVAA